MDFTIEFYVLFIAVHGVRNKGQTIAAGDLKTATERMEDWLKRVK